MKIITNWRYHALMLVGMIAVVGIVSVPTDDSLAWWSETAMSKGIGIAAAYSFYHMMKRWLANGSIPELEEMTKEED